VDTLPYDALDNLLTPLMIRTDRTFYELGYDPTGVSGYCDVDFRVLSNQLQRANGCD